MSALSSKPVKSAVCRCLFGPVDHDELRRDLYEEKLMLEARDRERFLRKWNFDLANDEPVSGVYSWEIVDENTDIPKAYAMPRLPFLSGQYNKLKALPIRRPTPRRPRPVTPSRPSVPEELTTTHFQCSETDIRKAVASTSTGTVRTTAGTSFRSITTTAPSGSVSSQATPNVKKERQKRITEFFSQKRKRPLIPVEEVGFIKKSRSDEEEKTS